MECPDEAAFAALVGGELSEDEARALDEHIDACAECFEILAAVAEDAAPAAAEEPPAQRFRRGAKVGRYVLEAVAGIGAMGTVYEALDPDLERRVALKIVRGPDALALEARLMAKLSHPNVMPIYDVGTEGEHVFLAMELID